MFKQTVIKISQLNCLEVILLKCYSNYL